VLRYAALFTFLTSFLLACQSDYTQCQQKVVDGHVLSSNMLALPISKKHTLIYSNTKPSDSKILKHDENLHLYLVEDKHPFKYPFELKDHTHQRSASITNKSITMGHITNHQVGISKFANFSSPIMTPSIIMDECCRVSAIATSTGLIESNYLEAFIHSKNQNVADLGFRVESKNNSIHVNAIDCSLEDMPVMMGDKVLSLNGKNISSPSLLMKAIFSLNVEDNATLGVLRNSEKLNLHVKVLKRYGGGFNSDTFLERFGMYFDKELCLVEDAPTYKLKTNDCLLEVNFVKVHNFNETREMMGICSDKVSLLFERSHFQFFVHPNGGKIPSKFKF